jgi:hypothetical protein
MATDLNNPKGLSHGVSAKSPQGQSLSFERLDKSSSNTLKVRHFLTSLTGKI